MWTPQNNYKHVKAIINKMRIDTELVYFKLVLQSYVEKSNAEEAHINSALTAACELHNKVPHNHKPLWISNCDFLLLA